MQVTGLQMRRYILQSRLPHVALGVPPTATRSQIRRAAKKLVIFLREYDLIDTEDQREVKSKQKAIDAINSAKSKMLLRASKPGRSRLPSVTFNAVMMRNKRQAAT